MEKHSLQSIPSDLLNKSSSSTLGPDPISLSFEAAFSRLEEILEQLNSGKLSLDVSLVLYEEANQLIAICNKRLHEAESKVEVLVKQRNGEIVLGHDHKPQLQEYRMTAVSSKE